tara:strand:- start:1040 stop:1522 length:483 start_codon:yes stop_codon:yes gene_type:complete
MATITSSLIGVNLNSYDSTAQFARGTQVMGTDGSLFQYVNTLSSIPAGNAVGIDESGNASNLTTTLAGTVKTVGVAQVSIAVSSYGWVQRSGVMNINVATNCAKDVLLFTTGTAGVLDDATISAAVLPGLNLITSTVSAATLGVCQASTPLYITFWANPA